MATINCRVALSEFNDGLGNVLLENITVTLINIDNFQGVVGLTNQAGNCSFINVPLGRYYLLETPGFQDASPSPVDFSTSLLFISLPTTSDPDIDTLDFSLKSVSNRIQSITPNVIDINIINFNTNLDFTFLDAPVRDIPLIFFHDTEIGDNLITAASNGYFGSYPSPIGTDFSPLNNPSNNFSPLLPPKYEYQQYNALNPQKGNYSLVNIINNFSVAKNWWKLADHTVGTELGMMQVIAGVLDTPFFTTTVNVKPNSYYSFSAWVCRLNKNPQAANPIIALKILDESNNSIFYQAVSGPLTLNEVPTWQQIRYAPIKTRENTRLTFQLSSFIFSPESLDIAVDDIVLKELADRIPKLPPNVSLTHTVDKTTAAPGDILTYKLIYKNEGGSHARTNVIIDTLPNYTTFVEPRVFLETNIGSYPDPYVDVENPINIGLFLGFPGQITTITYSVKIDNDTPKGTLISNTASVSYNYINEWDDEFFSGANSNVITTTIDGEPSDIEVLTITKDVDKSTAYLCDVLSYTITLTNTSTFTASEIAIVDNLPSNLSLIPNSLSINDKSFCGCPDISVILIKTITPNETVTIKFKAKIPNYPCLNEIKTSSRVAYKYFTKELPPRVISKQLYSNISKTTIFPYKDNCNCTCKGVFHY